MGKKILKRMSICVFKKVMFIGTHSPNIQVDCSPARLLCLWNSPGKNTGVGNHSLLQGIFSTQGLNLGGSLAWQANSLPSEPSGKR